MILDVDSLIPIGLIINEVLTNAIKYSFYNRKDGKIYLSIKEDGGHLKIKVKDNGVGIDDDKKRADSFGHRLIGMLLDQLEGSIKTSNNNGAEIDIIINKYQKAS